MPTNPSPYQVAIIGAGAAGYFCALNLAQKLKDNGVDPELYQISIFEKAAVGLRKVRISGGGRCNVTHDEEDNLKFLKHYPRGQRQLRTPLYEFNAMDTRQWFEKRGVKLKIEKDGRIFPVTNSSQTVIDCFNKEAQRLGVTIYHKSKVEGITYLPPHFQINPTCNEEDLPKKFHYLCLATGSDPQGHKLAQDLGHSFSEFAPSLFTFKCQHPLLRNLQGTSFKNAEVKIVGRELKGLKLKESGPLLITHWGLSGPAILKISAWGARELKRANYHFPFRVNFLGMSLDETRERLLSYKKMNLKKKITTSAPLEDLTHKFWASVIEFHKLSPDLQWANLSQKEINLICECLTSLELQSTGPHRHKEEFVECGGVSSQEINFKTLQSKLIEGLYFAGELLDIDGITGGFNFQNAWSTSYNTAMDIAQKITQNQKELKI